MLCLATKAVLYNFNSGFLLLCYEQEKFLAVSFQRFLPTPKPQRDMPISIYPS